MTKTAMKWVPKRARKPEAAPNVMLGIVGPPGVGKSFLVRQLAEDKEYKGRVVVYCSENSVNTYGEQNVKDENVIVVPLCHMSASSNSNIWVSPIEEAKQSLREIAAAKKKGEQEMPLVGVLDSLSGISDYMADYFEQYPSQNVRGDRDKRSEYGILGAGLVSLLKVARDEAGIDIIVLCTTTTGPMPELCVGGKVTGNNFTRLTTSTFYMTSHMDEIEETQLEHAKRKANRSFGRMPNGGCAVINRYFTTLNTGDIQAKGHDMLELREPAVLPDVLRKIHGR